MLSPGDEALATRDPAVPGLRRLLDAGVGKPRRRNPALVLLCWVALFVVALALFARRLLFSY